MRAESAGETRALSRAGAMGLMQIMPDTWAELRVRYGLGKDPYDPRDNILAGAAYLRELHDRYGSPGFLAAYNAGPSRYDDYLSADRPLPAETRAYVGTIAPLLGTGDLPSVAMSGAANEPSWRNAPLFVTASAARNSKAVSQLLRTDGAAYAPSQRDNSALEARSNGLFVAGNGQRGAP